MPQFIKSTNGYDVAYESHRGLRPWVVFLGGFRSDMQGTKAIYLETLCRDNGFGFIRFDYGGHGQSGGIFTDLCISDWTQDTLDVIAHVAGDDPVILAGSSMGGWISLLCAEKRPTQVKGLVGMASAPDFTAWIERDITPAQRQALETQGYFEEPSAYDSRPYIFTRKLIKDGARNAVMTRDLGLKIPVALLQGTADPDVPWQTAGQIKKALKHADCRLYMIEEGDHRLSRPEDLALLGGVIVEMHARF
ncbi:MAG: alpha/beta hydrolase [Alphaproteobacteria bacterium]|nr:alpha/beta hydrolase [Alphaproteobacteria bacterium]